MVFVRTSVLVGHSPQDGIDTYMSDQYGMRGYNDGGQKSRRGRGGSSGSGSGSGRKELDKRLWLIIANKLLSSHSPLDLQSSGSEEEKEKEKGKDGYKSKEKDKEIPESSIQVLSMLSLLKGEIILHFLFFNFHHLILLHSLSTNFSRTNFATQFFHTIELFVGV